MEEEHWKNIKNEEIEAYNFEAHIDFCGTMKKHYQKNYGNHYTLNVAIMY
jgi:phage anti-repressor protein